MTGGYVKEKLIEEGYKLSDIAQKMNVSPQSLHKFLLTEDIKTGVLERIAIAIDKNITFFFDSTSKEDTDLKIINEIISNEELIYKLYQRIVDVCILNTDYIKATQSYTNYVDKAAEILNSQLNPPFRHNEDSSITVKWEKYSLEQKKEYNFELEKSIKILLDMFFNQFAILYKNIRSLE